MAVKFTRGRQVRTSATTESVVDPIEELKQRKQEAVQCFRGAPVTPQSFLALEEALKQCTDDACRQVLEREVNRLEPDHKDKMPAKVRYQKERYRINKKTPAQVARGVVVLAS
jgi:hypothetical protein